MKSELTQIREGNRRVTNWRIVAGLMALLAIYALLDKLDTDVRLAEAERIAQLQPRIVVQEPVTEPAKPPVAVQRQASIGRTRGGVL